MVMYLGVCFVVVAVIVTAFQIALGLGAPLGRFALGGKYPGKLPRSIILAFGLLLYFFCLD